ncbi:MAG: aspartate-semialdehyde dehydrogenase [Anaerolineae bacterium]|nr:aspartate-semialdehyde dehydrogenase [Anaerolineae bacterium]MDW8067366.1 aspartate-semialdehyde dehydrogenase [Anaerolineae bacterium]
MEKIPVAVLGATGMIGQHFVQILAHHPWFEIAALAASERSAGKPYGEACEWVLSSDMPESVRNIPVQECRPNLPCRLVFSALPASIAGEVEEEFARAGYIVSSNARSHRMEPDVPLLVPEINPDHLDIIPEQQQRRGWKGFIVTNPNCSTAIMTMALKPLMDRFGLQKVMVVTMQALSGAGYRGVPSLRILDNVIPYISGEEEKMESETLKILGRLQRGPDGHRQFVAASLVVSAQCHRVATRDGHLEAISVQLGRKATREEVIGAFREFRGLPQEMGLPSAPVPPLVVRDEVDRPQPLLDRNAGRGMSVVIGRVRECPILDYKFVLLGHNAIRGAAGAAVLNAEMLVARGLIQA